MPRLFKALAVVLLVAIAGYGATRWVSDKLGPFAADDKLAAAFPVAPELQAQLANIIARFDDPAGVQSAKQQLQVRLSYRLLKCAPTYVPSWYNSLATVQERAANPACFARQDAALREWLGLIEVGLILRQPPLRTLPAEPAAPFNAEGSVRFARVATGAGIALVELLDRTQIIDIGTGEVLLRRAGTRLGLDNLSANGRLFSESDENGVLFIKEVESGRTVSQMPVMQGCRFTWLDVRTSTCLNDRYIGFVDFSRGQVITSDLWLAPFTHAAAVPGRPDHYVLLSDKKFVEMQVLQRDSSAPKAQLVRQEDTEALGFAQDWNEVSQLHLSADRSTYLIAPHAEKLLLFSLRDFTLRAIDTSPFRVTLALPTAEPNEVLLEGDLASSNGYAGNGFVLDIERLLIAPVTARRPYDERVVFVAAMPGVAVFRDQRVTLLKRLAVGDAIDLGVWRGQMVEEAATQERVRREVMRLSKERFPRRMPSPASLR